MTMKPKERQFQVVPVPAVFTRGRWECSDFKETQGPDSQILEFGQSSDKEKYLVMAAGNAISVLNGVGTQYNGGSNVATPIAPVPPELLAAGTNIGHIVTPSTSHFTPHSTLTNVTTSAPNLVEAGGVSMSPPTVTTLGYVSTNIDQNNSPFGNLANDSLSNHITEIPGAGSILSSTTIGPVAIDNKIEQAMDLVKTHLTFAVREEIELLRSKIVDLEAKVRVLDNENRMLRQYVPPEVLQNMNNNQ